MAKRRAKIVLLGDGAVGKTSLVRRYVEQTFDDGYITTIGANVKKKHISGLDLTMVIWDLHGQRRETDLQSKNYSGAEGALVVFDLTRKKTFEHLDRWMNDLYSVVGKIPVVFAVNKKDLIDDFQSEIGRKLDEEDKEDFHRYMVENHYIESIYRKETKFVPVTRSEIRGWLKDRKEELPEEYSFYFTSAKTGRNVEKAFRTLGEHILS